MTDRAPSPAQSNRKRAIVGATIGHGIEFFDFTVYGFLAVYIGAAFFPSDNSTTQLLSSFAVFGLAFFARPLGGFFFGPLADRIGRKRVLVIVLTLMSSCSVAIGLLPSYHSIGIAAPILLVVIRLLQGFSAGGEYASGSSFLLEYAGKGRRGFGVSWLTFATTSGLMLGITVVTALTAALGTDVMADWGWRIPFLLAAPLAAVALYIRLKLEDTPDFLEMSDAGEISEAPVREMFAMKRNIALIFGVGAMHTACFYAVFTYMPTYIGTVNSFGPTFALISTMVTGVAAMITLPTVAILSDRIGRRPVLLFGSLSFSVLVYPVFYAISVGNMAVALLCQLVIGVLAATYLAASAVTMAELFPTSIRTTGVAIGSNIPNALFGGSAPFIATFLIQETGHIPSPAFYLITLSVAAVIAAALLRSSDLHGDEMTVDEVESSELPVDNRLGI